MKILQAGPITVGYENGFLRRISYGEREIVRMIYFALRDHNWNTLTSQVENENIIEEDGHFEITYDCLNLDGGVTVMEWKCKITGGAAGDIMFEIRGVALENFRKNRAGFCILHPLNITAENCTIIHPDRTETTSPFPRTVAPENPFKNIQSMRWRTGGVPFILEFEGDIFETEDQRNWSDASFKTFCTPLDKPFPVELKRGSRVFQRVIFKPQEMLKAAGQPLPYITLRESTLRSVLPALGIAASSEVQALPEVAVSRLQTLNFSHYRIDVYPGNEDWVSKFSHSYENGFALGLPLEVVLHLTGNHAAEIEAFAVICRQNNVKLKKVLLLQTDGMVTGQKVIDQVSGLKKMFPKVSFGAGTNYNFNEINKNHFAPGEIDYVSFSIDPQEHAFDDLTILENTESLEHLVKSVKSIYGDAMDIHVSPLTLRKRFNPYATNPSDLFIDELKKADPRQKETFAAIWTFGCICGLTKGGASAITFFQTVGNQGILSKEGEPYPVFNTFKNFSPFQRKPVSILESSDPLSVQGILLDGKILALANLTPAEKSIRWDNREYFLDPWEMKFDVLNRA